MNICSRNLARFLLVLACAVLPNNLYAAETIKFGVGGSHTGELAGYGIPSLRAVELAADYINANGGLLGKQVEVIGADDQCKPELAPNAATNLLSEGVVGVIGMICSGPTKAVLPIFNDAKLISISPASTTPDLTLSGDNPYFLRTIGHDYVQGELAVQFIGTQLKAKKVAFLHDNGEYGKGYTETTRKRLNELYPEIEVVIFETVTPGSSDYSAIIRKVRREGAEVLIWGGYHSDASKIVNNMAALEFDIPLIGSDSLKDNLYIEIAGEASENTYASAPTDTSDNPLAIELRKAHLEKYGSPMGVFGDNAYAGAIALAEAIKTANTTDPDAVMKALQSQTVATPIGDISFDKNGDAIGIGMTMYKVENGVFIPVFELQD